MSVDLIDVAEMVRVQHRAFDVGQHPGVIAAREDSALPERARPLWIVFLEAWRNLAVVAEHQRYQSARQPFRHLGLGRLEHSIPVPHTPLVAEIFAHQAKYRPDCLSYRLSARSVDLRGEQRR